jgi:hypothetical protein
VVFRDRDSIFRNWDNLFTNIGRLRLFVQVVPKGLDEFWSMEKTFLEEVLRHGVVLFSKYPFTLSLLAAGLKRYYILSYDLSRLSQREKARLLYRLYGKGGGGVLDKIGGVKISEGCIMFPEDGYRDIIRLLDEYSVEYKLYEVYRKLG